MTDTNQFSSPRREFLRKAGTTATIGGFGATGLSSATAEDDETGPFGGDPFTLGVASGDPLPDSVVLWTRLAPEPLEEDGGMPDRQVPVQWQIATDEEMENTVTRGTAKALPAYAHSVHVDVKGLEPDTEYYYQFKAASYRTTVARTKTAPSEGAPVDEINFAFASCQDYVSGYYTALEQMADEDLDFAVHLGDYIYEGPHTGMLGREHQPPVWTTSLGEYRARYAQYKTDSGLQAAHAAFPWIVTWDDHEVINDYADEDHPDMPPEEFLERRANAYQAYFEHQPIRPSRMPDGPNLPLYRRFTFGDLAEFNVLDTRQYRDDQTNSPEEAADPDRTLLGDEQEEWLVSGLESSSSTWNVLAQQVPFAPVQPNSSTEVWGDKWDGYEADRETLIETMARQQDLNPVVLTGDVHRNYAYNINKELSDPDSETIGTEYIGTSLTSFGDGNGVTRFDGTEFNPHEKFFNNERGYVRCTLTPEQWRTDYRIVSTVEEPTASVRTLASFVTDDRDPGVKQTTGIVDSQVPDSYGSASQASTPFEMSVELRNPAGPDAEDVTMENVQFEVTSIPDEWSVAGATETTFDAVTNGESATATWDVDPTPVGDVQVELAVTYTISDEEYRHVVEEPMSEPKIAYWTFENTNADRSSYDHTFSLENGAGYDDQESVEGNYSLVLDGEDDYIRLSYENSSGFLHDAFSERTVSMWVKPASTAGIPVLYDEGGYWNGLAIRINEGKLEAGLASNRTRVSVSTPFDRRSWTHVAAVFDHGAFTLYVDGDEVASNSDVGFDQVPSHSNSGGIGSTVGEVYAFAGAGDPGDPFDGHIDATSIYSTALSPADVESLSNEF